MRNQLAAVVVDAFAQLDVVERLETARELRQQLDPKACCLSAAHFEQAGRRMIDRRRAIGFSCHRIVQTWCQLRPVRPNGVIGERSVDRDDFLDRALILDGRSNLTDGWN